MELGNVPLAKYFMTVYISKTSWCVVSICVMFRRLAYGCRHYSFIHTSTFILIMVSHLLSELTIFDYDKQLCRSQI